MAGDIQEPCRLSFQAESFHSGSISFGRFETEALCWERRSSFSHNRYLEEVEKCSKPGSVTEKKAYFEAHFRRKALLSQNSPDCQSGIDCQSSENEKLQSIGCEEDIENLNEHSNATSYDESPGHSLHEREFAMTDHELDNSGTSHSYPDGGHAFGSADSEDVICEYAMIAEAHQVEDGNSSLRTTEWESDVKQNLNDDGEVTTSDMSSKTGNLLPSSPTADKEVCSKQEPGPPSKVNIVNTTLTTSHPSVVHTKKNISRAAFNGLGKKPVKRESGVPMKSIKEKQLSESSASTMHSSHKTLKPEASSNSKTKLHESKSHSNAKESTTKKAVSSRPSTAEKVAPRAHQNASRSMRAVNSTKQFINQNGSAFSLKSDERVERRKEFNIKLEAKVHAKNTEMQEVQDKKQEMTEADIKLLRKSLNFKARPMPSFYSEAGQWSDRNKVLANNRKSSKVQNRPSSPAIGATRSPSFPSVGSGQAHFTTESIKTISSVKVAVVPSCALASCSGSKTQFSDLAASDCHPTPSAVDKGHARKEEQQKVIKHTSLQKQRASEDNKLNKGQKVEKNSKVGAQRRMKSEIRKDIKGVDLRNSSRMSNIAVGVAS